MTRLSFALLLGVLASALFLVKVQYESRHLYSELDRAKSQAHRLTAENERMQVEKRNLSTSARVEKLAKSQLQMRVATPAVTTYVSYASAPAKPTPAIAASQGRAP